MSVFMSAPFCVDLADIIIAYLSTERTDLCRSCDGLESSELNWLRLCVSVCVAGPQSWMLWCLVTSSLYWRPGWPAPSWQSGSRATATCCLSADASNRPTSKTRAPEGLRITLYHLILYILSFLISFPNSLQRCEKRVPYWFSPSFLPPLAFCWYIVTWCHKEPRWALL